MPSLEMIGRWLSGIGLFLSGMIVGSAVYMSIHQANFSILVDRNARLQDENDDLRKEIQNWNKYKNSQSVVKKVTVRFDPAAQGNAIDPLTEQELKQQVQKRLEAVYEGQGLSQFSSAAEIQKLKEMVGQRYYIKETDYKVEATTIAVVQTELIVYIRAHPFTVADSFRSR